MTPWTKALFLSAALLLPAVRADEASDLAAARELFERNITAIQARDREAYLACYLESERLVRSGPEGFELGFAPLAEGTAPSGDDAWPETLGAREISLTWLRPGMVFGTYRYHVVSDGEADDGLSERLFVQTDDGWCIAVTTAFPARPDVPAAAIALVGATAYDGLSDTPIEDAVIVVRSGVIEAVGTRDTVDLPEGIDVLDLTGRWLTPGLVDTHVHYSQTGWADGRPDATDVRERWPYAEAMAGNRRHPERFHRAFLYSGVTAVFDVGGYPWTRALGAATEHDKLAPHVAATGALFSTIEITDDTLGLLLPDSRQFVHLSEERQVRAAVRAHAATGSAAIKVWYVLRSPADVETFAPLVRAVADEARAVDLPLVVHATSLEAARVAVDAGAHLLVHSVEDAEVDDAFVHAAAAGGVHYCPTLTVRAGYHQLYLRQLSDELRNQLAAVHPSVRARVLATEELPADPRFRSPEMAARLATARAAGLERMGRNLLRMHAAGVPVVLGTDAGNPLTLHGPSVFPELEAMAAAGLSPGAVLRAATSDAANAMGRPNLGRLAPGAVADILILTADPGTDVSNLRTIERVVRAGQVHLREDLRPR